MLAISPVFPGVQILLLLSCTDRTAVLVCFFAVGFLTVKGRAPTLHLNRAPGGPEQLVVPWSTVVRPAQAVSESGRAWLAAPPRCEKGQLRLFIVQWPLLPLGAVVADNRT